MRFLSWLRNLETARARVCGRGSGAPRPRATFRPRLEALEDRWLPTILTVTTTADSGPGSLRADVAAAQSGDTIDLSGLSGQTISLTSGELVLNKNLTIQGPAAPQAPATISNDGGSRMFEIDGTTTQVALSNLNLTDGIGMAGNAAGTGALNGQGGAIWNGGMLTLNACNLSGNHSATQGGALWNGGTLTLNACDLSSNSCYDASEPDLVALGGAIYNVGTLTISSSTLSGNSAGVFPSITIFGPEGGDGGAIYNAGTLTVNNSILSGNLAYQVGSSDGYGGGIFNDKKGHLKIQSTSSITNNFLYDVYSLGAVSISKDSSIGTILK
jgi:hypothetical protein